MAMGIIVWICIGVVAVVAIIGVLFITRGTSVHRVRAVGSDGAPVDSSEPAFPLAVALLTGTPTVPGNRVELALDGDGTFPRLWDDLRGAQQSISIQMYYAAPGVVANTLAAILDERARAGVRVFVLFDAFGSSLPRSYLARLRSAGVHVVRFRPLRFENLWIVQNRSHIRGIVVDGRVGWTGGFGFDDKWLGGGRRIGEWRETNVRFEGPAVRQLQAAFVASWSEATGELLTGRMALDTYEDGVSRRRPARRRRAHPGWRPQHRRSHGAARGQCAI